MKRTIATESGAFFPQPPALSHQEPQRHEACCHVVMPATPGAYLVVVEPYPRPWRSQRPPRRGAAARRRGRVPREACAPARWTRCSSTPVTSTIAPPHA